MMASAMVVSDWDYCVEVKCLVTGLYNWQTLIGGLIAIGAAFIAARAVKNQISASDRQEQERYRRRMNASRSLLPLALRSLNQYARDSAEFMKGIIDRSSQSMLVQPDVPEQIIAELATVIEATEDMNVIHNIRKMIGNIQVLDSRMLAIGGRTRSDPTTVRLQSFDFPDLSILAATIHAQSDALFDFARFEVETVPEHVTWMSVTNSLKVMGYRGSKYDSIFDLCRERERSGRYPDD
jgi:hypothetical protein